MATETLNFTLTTAWQTIANGHANVAVQAAMPVMLWVSSAAPIAGAIGIVNTDFQLTGLESDRVVSARVDNGTVRIVVVRQ